MKSVTSLCVRDKKVFVRVDYNLPMDKDGNITDDNRIVATLDLIEYLIGQGAKIILASHLGRPKGGRDESLSLAPAARCLAERLGRDVAFVRDCIGPEVEQNVSQLKSGDILMLENLRFYSQEKKNDPEFAKKTGRALRYLCEQRVCGIPSGSGLGHRDYPVCR